MFTSRNLFVFRDVYYAPKISRNLISGYVLNRLGNKLVFEADRCKISKGSLFIGRAYLQCNLFKPSLVCNNYVYNIDAPSNIFDDLH